MTAEALLDALALPPGTRFDRRVPKALLAEHATTAADRRLVRDGVEALWWTHALKPTTAGVPTYRDNVREYLEVAVLHLTVRGGASPERLAALVHRAIPYPVVLLTEHGGAGLSLSMAHTRAALREPGRVVMDGEPVSVTLTADTPALDAFLGALALAAQPQTSLWHLYGAWIDAALALDAARVVGHFQVPATPEAADARRQGLADLARLDAQIATLLRTAAKEKQMARRVDLNLELARLRAARDAARDAL